jgi:hypothetical protein
MELRFRPRIGVVGPALCSPEVYNRAREVGFLIGRQGAILICGGRGGVMEASAKGTREAGGISVGILPGDSAAEANPYIDIPIVTDLGNARNSVNVLTSQAVIAIALAMKCRIPVVGLETWDMVAPGGEPLPITLAHSPEEAVTIALNLISST